MTKEAVAKLSGEMAKLCEQALTGRKPMERGLYTKLLRKQADLFEALNREPTSGEDWSLARYLVDFMKANQTGKDKT